MASRIRWICRSSPTSRHWMSVLSDACATPLTISSGAESPPMASTAIVGMAHGKHGSEGLMPCQFRSRTPRGREPAASDPRLDKIANRLSDLAIQPPPQLALADTVLERLTSVHHQHRDLRAKFGLQGGVSGDVDFLHRPRELPRKRADHRQHFVAQVAPRTGIECEHTAGHQRCIPPPVSIDKAGGFL